jgi:hypothetical protein
VEKFDIPLNENDRWLTIVSKYERLIELGVDFSITSTEMGTVKIAVFDDTCGNNIQLVEMF